MDPDSLGTVENPGLDRPLWIGGPGVQFRPGNPHQAAGQIQPHRMGVVFHHPVKRIAGKSVPAAKCDHTAVFHPAEPAVGCGPKCAVAIQVKAVDTAAAQPFAACIRCADLAVLEIRYAARGKAKPQTALHRIVEQSGSHVFASEFAPGNPFDHTRPHQMKKAIAVTHPDVPRGVRGNGINDPVGHGAHGNEPVRVENGDSTKRCDPNLPAIILREGVHLIIRQSTSSNLSHRPPLPGNSLGSTALGRCTSLAVNRDLPVIPPVQAVIRADPNAAVARRQNGLNASARQTLLDGNRGDGEAAKAVEAADGRYPYTAFRSSKRQVTASPARPSGWLY